MATDHAGVMHKTGIQAATPWIGVPHRPSGSHVAVHCQSASTSPRLEDERLDVTEL